jgi:hypothetical protein
MRRRRDQPDERHDDDVHPDCQSIGVRPEKPRHDLHSEGRRHTVGYQADDKHTQADQE